MLDDGERRGGSRDVVVDDRAGPRFPYTDAAAATCRKGLGVSGLGCLVDAV